MPNNIYILSVYDIWTDRDRMQNIGATTDETVLQAMIAAKIKDGDITYGNNSNQSWERFLHDYEEGVVDYDKLNRGSVRTYDDLQIAELLTMNRFPEIDKAYEELANAKAKKATRSLNLNERSLTYSMVEVRTDFGHTDFLMPGVCEREGLESDDHFQEFMEGRTDANVHVCVRTCSVGSGESEYPDDNELTIIENFSDELDDKYGVDLILSDYFNFNYQQDYEFEQDD